MVRSLEDGQWHFLSQIRRGFGITDAQSERIMSFLSRFELVVLDESGEKIRIDFEFLELPV